MLGNKQYPAEVVPVDMAIFGLITIAWTNGIMKQKYCILVIKFLRNLNLKF